MNFISDSENCDHVTILLARVCAARLDATIKADDFVRMVARLVDVAVAEAVEDLRPVPHVRVTDADRVPAGIVDALKSNRAQYTAGGERIHLSSDICWCRDQPDNEANRWCESFDDDQSTGATEAKSNAEQLTPATAASESSVAPSTHTPQGAVSVVKPPGGASAKPGQGTEETGTDRPAAPVLIAEPAPPSKAAAPLSDVTAGGAGAPPAGPHAGAEGSQRGVNKRGSTPVFSDDDLARLRADYQEACATDDGRPPYGWIRNRQRALGISESTMRRALGLDKHRVEKRRNGSAANAEPIARRDHTHSHACWCRKTTNTSRNPWCSNKPTTGVLPGLRSRVPPSSRRGMDA